MTFPPKSNGGPSPGYDDHTIIPKERLKFLTAEFEKELRKIEDYIRAELPGQFNPDQNLKLHLNSMNYAAKELGDIFLDLVDDLTRAYHAFEANAELNELNELLSCLKRLNLSLSI